jgi:DNA polymerase II small subunit
MNSEERVKYFAERGFLLSPELLEKIEDIENPENLLEMFDDKIVVVNEVLLENVEGEKVKNLNWRHFDEARVSYEKKGKDEEYEAFLNVIFENPVEISNGHENGGVEYEEEGSNVVVLKSFNESSKKLGVGDFVSYFNHRYKILKEILSGRTELREAISIHRAKSKNNEKVALIGMVNEKRVTKNDNVLIELEDVSGKINVLVLKNKFELKDLVKDIVMDEVIGLIGSVSNEFMFVDKIIFPDVPMTKELKKSDKDEEAVFISDIHVGGKDFLEKDFLKFLDWLKSEKAEKVKYLFIVGDLIEGVGIYPGQEEDLAIKDYYKQYERLVQLLKDIPDRISVVICPGNHDALRLDEPQPAMGEDFLRELLDRKNVYSVSNPAVVNIGADKDFVGFDVLLYHGGSFPYYADVVDSIRLEGGLTKADMIMKFLLQKRHMAPTHTSTSYFAGNKDHLVIDKIPDFFVSGHIHRCVADNYHNVTILNCSCWVPQSDYMERRGLVPEPSRAIVVNLRSRKCEIRYFGEEEIGSE